MLPANLHYSLASLPLDCPLLLSKVFRLGSTKAVNTGLALTALGYSIGYLLTGSFLSGYRTVDALLQRMFEADLNLDDLAENDKIEADSSGNFANPAFDSV